MEDDEGLELSLGLACGRSSSHSKDTSDMSAGGRTDTDERTNKILNDFRKFLNAGFPQSFRTTNPVKPQDNFNLQQTATGGNDSVNVTETCEKKRKGIFVWTENNKKQETESYSSVVQGKGKSSHISITTDEGSIGDNEDVAESGVEDSTSRIVFHRDDVFRTAGGSATSFPVQTMNISSVPYSKNIEESSSASVPSTPVYPLAIQSFLRGNGGQSISHVTSTGSLAASRWAMARSQLLRSPYDGSSIPTSVSMQVTNLSSSEPTHPRLHRQNQLRGLPKSVPEEGSSSQPEDKAEARASTTFPSEYPAIFPGIATELKLGGSGSFPNLPWVSTTGSGPNGKTISGVTYKDTATQIKIVCACHGLHFSPEEFLRHASEDHPSAITSFGLASPLQPFGPAN
ncbi:hypothetical protein RND81_07G093700 [Saponaria officinalis]|uniref:Ninja-family protein n=1 Tax=Saponaria officinalis TaxID=3572 RepID=A0AAW1JNZ3_SAPOF